MADCLRRIIPISCIKCLVQDASKFYKTRATKRMFKPSAGNSPLTSDGDF